MTYEEFRTGLTFDSIYRELRAEVENPEHFRTHITRHTILGRWHQRKIEMYSYYTSVMKDA